MTQKRAWIQLISAVPSFALAFYSHGLDFFVAFRDLIFHWAFNSCWILKGQVQNGETIHHHMADQSRNPVELNYILGDCLKTYICSFSPLFFFCTSSSFLILEANYLTAFFNLNCSILSGYIKSSMMVCSLQIFHSKPIIWMVLKQGQESKS